MSAEKRSYERMGFAVGGGTMIGLGIGFVFLRTSPLLFVACLLAGIGVGLLVSALIMKQ